MCAAVVRYPTADDRRATGDGRDAFCLQIKTIHAAHVVAVVVVAVDASAVVVVGLELSHINDTLGKCVILTF